MEINVTALIKMFQDDDLDPAILSGSIAEHGYNAGQYTWNNCMELAETAIADSENDLHLLASELRQDTDSIKQYFASFGAWTNEEINTWSETELIAIAIQEVATTYRELEGLDFEIESDQFSGLLFQCNIEGDENFGDWYFCFGM